MASTAADERAKLVQAIEKLLDTEKESTARLETWQVVEKAIDFFENTVDYESFEAGKVVGVEELEMEGR